MLKQRCIYALDRNTHRLIVQQRREQKIEKRRQKSLERKAARAAAETANPPDDGKLA